MSGELALKGFIEGLFNNMGSIVEFEISAGLTLSSLEKFASEFGAFQIRLGNDVIARVECLRKAHVRNSLSRGVRFAQSDGWEQVSSNQISRLLDSAFGLRSLARLFPSNEGLRFLSRESIILAMQEVLSNTDDPRIPLREQEFFELSLLNEANDLGTRYCVRQAHAEWSDIDGQIMWDQEEVDHFWVLGEARKRYVERKFALAEKGFIYSDMDL